MSRLGLLEYFSLLVDAEAQAAEERTKNKRGNGWAKERYDQCQLPDVEGLNKM